MKSAPLERSQGGGKILTRDATPARAGGVARRLLWLCAGAIVLILGGRPDAQSPPRLQNALEPPSPRGPDPPLLRSSPDGASSISAPSTGTSAPALESGPSPDRTSSGSSLSVESLKEEELEVARQLIRDYPNDSTPLGFLGNVYSKHGLNKEATRYWEESLRIEPNRADMYDAMASVALLRQEYDRALELRAKRSASIRACHRAAGTWPNP